MLQTQWRLGPAGPGGLDYGAIEPVLRLMGVKKKHWPELFDDLRVMEGAALKQMNKKD